MTPQKSSGEYIAEILPTLPPPIQKILTSGELIPVVLKIKNKYGLHDDSSGIVERELVLLLLGLEDPTQVAETFTKELPVSSETVSGIMNDLNTQVFIPLQAKMHTEEEVSPAKVAAPTPPLPAKPITQQPRPAGSVASAPLPPKTALPQAPIARNIPDFQKIVPLPANLPGVAPKIPAPRPAPRPLGVDPYREPFDDKK